MAYEFRQTRRVEFADTDMAGIMHFTAFFRFMEATEHAFYRSLGFSVHTRDEKMIRSFPRVAASCAFREPIRFEDEVEVQLLVKAKKPKAIEYVFVFRNGGKIAARGEMTVVYATRPTGQPRMRAAEMPAEIADKIEAAPGELLTVEER